MASTVVIEHATFGLMGPLAHTSTTRMAIHCVIFHIGDRVVLLDTGFGTQEMDDPQRLLGADALFTLGILIDPRLTAAHRLRARGIEVEQVTDIVLTHLDNDHVGGLHDFPHALVHVAVEELDAYDGTQPRGPYRPYQVSHQTRFKTYGPTDELWFGLPARSLDLPDVLDAKLVPLPGHTAGHCGVAYREDGRWSLHAGDAYFDRTMNFLAEPPGLPLEIAFQTDFGNRVATLAKLRELRLTHADDIRMFCAHDQSEYLSWTDERGLPDPLIRYQS
ncbi:MBL fold metallo-hydrolase [Mycolicibacterium sp. 018/SC-01/001]|uniref:MBL fold metallo-hydrolase n=1 Tax=Mycolicibacterium sp. 018/SC-01/001 TaxID=2592069 RepID=UPI00117DA6B5|nr:MBL fold metallo-hydrolase [Mycolicibacterium sp. 018/SC-01/001]TRW80749.1 MBL fold metallo-hydrolase [Mycolicibacterium sp. 018/SC-01/001]